MEWMQAEKASYKKAAAIKLQSFFLQYQEEQAAIQGMQLKRWSGDVPNYASQTPGNLPCCEIHVRGCQLLASVAVKSPANPFPA